MCYLRGEQKERQKPRSYFPEIRPHTSYAQDSWPCLPWFPNLPLLHLHPLALLSPGHRRLLTFSTTSSCPHYLTLGLESDHRWSAWLLTSLTAWPARIPPNSGKTPNWLFFFNLYYVSSSQWAYYELVMKVLLSLFYRQGNIYCKLNNLPLDRIRPTGLWIQVQAPMTMTSTDLFNLEKTQTRYDLIATINSKMMTKTGC